MKKALLPFAIAALAIQVIGCSSPEKNYAKANELEQAKNYKEAQALYEKAAAKDHPDACYRLGCLLTLGEDSCGIASDTNRAIALWKQGAEAGSSESAILLGTSYWKGRGVEADFDSALHYYSKAIELGNCNGAVQLGNLYKEWKDINKRDYVKAMSSYKKAIEMADTCSEAYRLIGKLYHDGNGVLKDYAKANEYFQLAIDRGNAKAIYNLSNSYCYGEGVAKDYTKSIALSQEALDKGYARGSVGIGYMYDRGYGVKKDVQKAMEYYQEAANKGEAVGWYNMAFIYYNGNGVKKDPVKAFEYWMKAALMGDLDAQYEVGYSYQTGDGVAKDRKEAIKWYKKAAEQGNTKAIQKLRQLT